MKEPVRLVKMGELTSDQILVGRAGEAIHRDGASPAGVFELLEALLQDGKWQRINFHGRQFTSFCEFVTAPSNYGLATTPDDLRKIVDLRHPQESSPSWSERAHWVRKEVRRLLDEDVLEALPVGRPVATTTKNVRGTNIKRTDTDEYVVARLKRDDPELAARVVAREITPNAAAHAKGWRKPRVLLTSPASVARKLREHFTADQLAELIRFLIGGDDP